MALVARRIVEADRIIKSFFMVSLLDLGFITTAKLKSRNRG